MRAPSPFSRVPLGAGLRLTSAQTSPIRPLASSSLLAAPPGSSASLCDLIRRRVKSSITSSLLVRHSYTDAKQQNSDAQPSPEANKPQEGAIRRLLARLRPASGKGAAGPQEAYPDLSKMWKLAATQKKTLMLALALLLISSSVTLTMPAVIGRLIDLFGNDDTHAFWGLTFSQIAPLLVGIFAIGAAAKAGSNIMLDMSAIRLTQNLRQRSFSSALRQDVEWADKHAGDVVSRLSVDTTIVGDSLTEDIGDGLRAAVTVAAAGTAMCWISTDITLLMLGIVPPAAIGAVWYGRYIRELTHKTQDAVGKMTDVATERLGPAAFRTITAYNAQNKEDSRLMKEIKAIASVQLTEAKATGYFYAGTGFIGNCAILTLLAYGGSLVAKGVLTTGDLTSLMMYTAYLGGGLANLTSFFASIMKGMGAGARVFALMEREPHIQSGLVKQIPDAANPTVEFRHVDFAYPSRPERPILQDFSLKIKPGTSVALCGPSGAGKSSVHSLVLRLYDTDQGQVCVSGHDVKEYDLDALRSLFGVVGQDPVMFEGTIADNISYSRPGATQAEVEAAAESANCIDFIRALPLGFETNARQLSGGQRQRISIARSLLRGAPILLMDEATSALDTNSEHLINSTIQKIVQSGQATVWIIAHRLSTIKSADVIVLLDEGRVAEVGSFAELNVPGTKFEKLVRAQLTDSGESRNDLIVDQTKLDDGEQKALDLMSKEMGDFPDELIEANVLATIEAEKAAREDPTAGRLGQSEMESMLALVDMSQPVPAPPPEDQLELLAAAQYAERLGKVGQPPSAAH